MWTSARACLRKDACLSLSGLGITGLCLMKAVSSKGIGSGTNSSPCHCSSLGGRAGGRCVSMGSWHFWWKRSKSRSSGRWKNQWRVWKGLVWKDPEQDKEYGAKEVSLRALFWALLSLLLGKSLGESLRICLLLIFWNLLKRHEADKAKWERKHDSLVNLGQAPNLPLCFSVGGSFSQALWRLLACSVHLAMEAGPSWPMKKFPSEISGIAGPCAFRPQKPFQDKTAWSLMLCSIWT